MDEEEVSEGVLPVVCGLDVPVTVTGHQEGRAKKAMAAHASSRYT